jgi:hypothetical protein
MKYDNEDYLVPSAPDMLTVIDEQRPGRRTAQRTALRSRPEPAPRSCCQAPWTPLTWASALAAYSAASSTLAIAAVLLLLSCVTTRQRGTAASSYTAVTPGPAASAVTERNPARRRLGYSAHPERDPT